MTLILIVEDDEKIAANVLLRLREAGHGATTLRSGEEALRWLRDATNVAPDLLLVDVRLPGMSGVELLRRIDGPLPPTIVMSGEASMAETVEAIRLGVHDFLDKPFTRERLLKSVANCLEHAALRKQVDALREQRGPRILGQSEEAKTLRASIARVAATDARVLIRGESGTGKELVAAALHHGSRRHAKPLVKLNCAAIPAHLIEDELFGHARGAFTDAKTPKPGLFEQADGGTLFLDEIGDMDLALQSRLLRVLEDGRVRRLGETADRGVNVRVVSATHRDLQELVRSGAFREDLFFRLATVPIDVPPLRRRPDDVPLLFTSFLEQFCRINGRAPLHVAADVFARLRAYEWPGNVRELRNLAERLAVLGSDPVTVEQLPMGASYAPAAEEDAIVPLRDFKAQREKEYIERVLRETNWNVTRAAELLDVQRTYLHQKMVALGLRRP
ncbi:MAG TPA: sigma-54 dependent transcriptional regulator [Thermoanaerobaculia bacterium]|nr:sigma-54 dependent transcriptional regulator [Thermoanaerobaculia bacterium]